MYIAVSISGFIKIEFILQILGVLMFEQTHLKIGLEKFKIITKNYLINKRKFN